MKKILKSKVNFIILLLFTIISAAAYASCNDDGTINDSADIVNNWKPCVKQIIYNSCDYPPGRRWIWQK